MRLLVLGGTAFVGRAVVENALSRGWEVTTFNRGLTDSDVAGVRLLRGDRWDSDAVATLAGCGPWDAAVDCSGFVPRNVLAVAGALSAHVDRYVFVSTVSVYQDWPISPLSEGSPVLYCPPDAGPDFGTDIEDGPTRYGYQKAGCEAASREVMGTDRAVALRPGVVLGPREYIGRLPWWLRRVSRSGRVAAPDSPTRTIQPVDARDVASFALTCVADRLSGAYNLTAPIGRETFGGLLDACIEATGSDAVPTWIPSEILKKHGVRQWSEMPLWRTFDGVWKIDARRAEHHGLTCRPLAQTVSDTWAWMAAGGEVKGQRVGEIGLGAERETQLLAWADGTLGGV